MKNAIWSDDEVGAGRSSLPDYLSQTEGNVGRVVSPPLPAPAVTTNINIITIRGTHAAAYTSLHLTGTTMFSLNMRGLCHASLDTVYRRDSVLCHCHPPDNWPECQLLFIRVHQSLYITITQWHIALFQFFSIKIYKFFSKRLFCLSFFSLDYWMTARYFLCFLVDHFWNLDVLYCLLWVRPLSTGKGQIVIK